MLVGCTVLGRSGLHARRPLRRRRLRIRVGGPLLKMARTMVDRDGDPVAFHWTVASPTTMKLRIFITGDDEADVSAFAEARVLRPVQTYGGAD